MRSVIAMLEPVHALLQDAPGLGPREPAVRRVPRLGTFPEMPGLEEQIVDDPDAPLLIHIRHGLGQRRVRLVVGRDARLMKTALVAARHIRTLAVPQRARNGYSPSAP